MDTGVVAKWERLPQEVLAQIFTYLHLDDVISSSYVCRNWNGGTLQRWLWNYIVYHVTPDMEPNQFFLRLTHAPMLKRIQSDECSGDVITAECIQYGLDMKQIDCSSGISAPMVHSLTENFLNLVAVTLNFFSPDITLSLLTLNSLHCLKEITFSTSKGGTLFLNGHNCKGHQEVGDGELIEDMLTLQLHEDDEEYDPNFVHKMKNYEYIIQKGKRGEEGFEAAEEFKLDPQDISINERDEIKVSLKRKPKSLHLLYHYVANYFLEHLFFKSLKEKNGTSLKVLKVNVRPVYMRNRTLYRNIARQGMDLQELGIEKMAKAEDIKKMFTEKFAVEDEEFLDSKVLIVTNCITMSKQCLSLIKKCDAVYSRALYFSNAEDLLLSLTSDIGCHFDYNLDFSDPDDQPVGYIFDIKEYRLLQGPWLV